MAAAAKKFHFAHTFKATKVVVRRLAGILRSEGYEVNAERVGWRVLMWRKGSPAWSTAHTGLSACGNERGWLNLSGPEIAAVREITPDRLRSKLRVIEKVGP